jgi:hypothetical protein
MRTLGFSLSIALLGLSSTAHAHFILSAPPGVIANEGQGKGPPPCGPDTGAAANPTAVQGGKPLMVKVTETVGHPGFYRVALALKSRTEFPVDNVVYDKANKVLPPNGMPSGTSDHADYQNPPVFPVLADNLFPHTDAPNGKVYMGTVDIPNVNCDRCILQVIEFMAQHGWNGTNGQSNGGYFYHHCAELKITADPNLPLFNPGGGTDGGATDAKPDGGATGAGGTTGAAGTGAGAAGTSGGAGGTTGAAGTGSSTGAAGTTATAGTGGGAAGTTAAAGTGGGAAGTRGGGDGGGGGCAVAGGAASLGGLLLGLGALIATRRRRRG